MPGPRISERYQYMTVPQAAGLLGIHPSKLRRRINEGIFPAPTYTNPYGVRFFDKTWLKGVQRIIKNSFEGKNNAKG